MGKVVFISVCGTGGHAFPAQALAQALEESKKCTVHLICDQRGKKLMEEYCLKLPRTEINVIPFRGNIFARLQALVNLTYNICQILLLTLKKPPAAVVGFGGYASIPMLYSAIVCRKPIIIHEQNAVLGKTNRFFGKIAKFIALSFNNTQNLPNTKSGQERYIVTGLPIRSKIAKLKPNKTSRTDDKLHILILGGSLGAGVFSSLVPNAIKILPKKIRAQMVITHQARDEDLQKVRKFYEEMKIQADVRPFFLDIEKILPYQDLMISRAGASVVAELTHLAIPAILIPFPNAAENHQYYNALQLANAGACYLMDEHHTDAEQLARKLNEIYENPALLKEMRDSYKELPKLTSATTALRELVLELLSDKKK